MFLHKISTRVVCVNGKQPYDILESFAGEPLSFLRSKVTWRDYGANGRNIVGQQLSTLLDVTRKMLHVASVCTPCCMLLNVVGQSLKPAKAGQTFSPG